MGHSSTTTNTSTSRGFRRLLLALLIGVICLLVLVSGLLLFVRFGVDGERLAAFAMPKAEAALGKRIEYASMRLEWLTGTMARVSLTDVRISDRKLPHTWVRLASAVFEMDLLSLLKGTIGIQLARLTEPVVFIPPGSSWAQQAPAETSGTRRGPPVLLAPVVERLEITQAKVVLGSPENARGEARTLLSNIDITGTQLSPFGVSNFSIRGIAPAGDHDGSFHLSGSASATPLSAKEWKGDVRALVSDFPLSTVRVVASRFGRDLPITEGLLNLDLAFKGEPSHFDLSCDTGLSKLVVAPGRVFLRKVPVESARFRGTANRTGDTLLINLSEIAVPGLSLAAEAKVAPLDSPDAMLTVTLKKADLELSSIFPFIPLNLLRPEDRDRLKEAGLTGHIVLTGGQWSGKLADFVERFNQGTILLDALLDKVSGFIPGVGLRVANATGQIRYSADEVLFRSVSLTVGSSPIVLNGWIQNLQTKPKIDLFLNMTAQAQDLSPILESPVLRQRLEPWLGFVTEPTGSISLTLDIKGDLYRPDMKGRLQVDDVGCRVKGLPLPVKKLAGTINFRRSEAVFSEVRGQMGDSPFELSGSVSPDSVEVTADGKFNPVDIKPWIPASWGLSGNVPVSVTLKGKNPSLNFSFNADLKANGLRAGSFIDKRPGVPLRIEASGTRDSQGISVEEAYLVFNQTRISAKLNMNDRGSIALFVNLPPRGIQTDDIVRLTDPQLDLQPGGRLEGDAVIKSSTENPGDASIEANLTLSHVTLRLPGMYKRTEGLTGTIFRRAKSVNITIERARVGSSLIQGTMAIADLETPKLDINLESPFLDTTDFTAPAGVIPKMTWGEWIRLSPLITFLARSRGTGTIKIVKGKTAVRTFSNFEAHLEGANGLIRATKWQMGYADGIIRGSALFDIRNTTQKPLAIDFQGDHLRMERVLPSDPDRMRIESDMVTEGHMEWKLGNTSPENNGMYKTGTIEVRLHDGVIHRFEVLSKIFSLINLGSLVRGRLPDVISQGLSFQRLTWRMEVFDTKWKIKELKLLSDAARIDSSGMYFSGQDRLDFKVDVSPLVGLDALVSGLFGNLLTNDGKILTTTFRVRGLYGSPDVRLEPFESLSQGN